jgi:hypothetical protein
MALFTEIPSGEQRLTDLNSVFDLSNLRRAYRWIMSNPDPQYKSYFRDSYDAFALSSDTHLKWIRQEGLAERYQASHASKLLLPKSSGTLRVITLLTVEDQIVYQACVNLIADAIKKKTARRYEKKVFAHLYAGKSSPFFYKQWQKSYRRFSRKISDSFSLGYHYIADFDLASFYDSIGHHVLRHFLKELTIDEDTINFLLSCLRVWTSSTWSSGPANIYHEHGIPQGPLSSGMLSEAVLWHLDEAGEQGSKTIYLRYVDDIKIMAKTEGELRRKLIKLDISSKEIGLFPQTSKINIHRIVDPEDETKSVSRPPEEALRPVDQTKIVNRILQITRNGTVEVKYTTRFKYVLANANPTSKLNSRLIRVLLKHPELANSICRYIAKYDKIPRKLAEEIKQFILDPELYHSVNAALLRVCLYKMPENEEHTLGRFCADRLVRPKRGSIPIQPSYKEALIAWGLYTRSINVLEYDKIFFSEADWWVKKCAIRELDDKFCGVASYQAFVNRFMRSKEGEVSRIGVQRLLEKNLKLEKPYGGVEDTAKRALKSAGVIKVVKYPDSRINEVLSYILNRTETAYAWKKFYDKDHRHAELMAIFLKQNRETNIDAFMVQLDSYFDFLIYKLYPILKPGKTYPTYGSALKDPLLIAKLPKMLDALSKLHYLRLQSTTAHPRGLKTGAPTRKLKHKDFYGLRKELAAAFDEFEAKIIS